MKVPGIEPPPRSYMGGLPREAVLWLNELTIRFPRVRSYTAAIDAPNVPANSTVQHTVTVAGLSTEDVVIVNKPSYTAGIGIGAAWVSAANTLEISYFNVTGGGVNPGAETYRIMAVRL